MTKEIDPKDFMKAIKQDTKRWLGCAKAALFDEANKIMNASVRITPMDTGNLRRSAFVAKPKETGSDITIELGYGGFAEAYALAVHEMPRSNNFQEPGTGPKYLERPFDAAQRGQASRLTRDALDRFLSDDDSMLPAYPKRPK
jgi:hypothetical protein